MKFLEATDEYIRLTAWAEKIVDEIGSAGAGVMLRGIEAQLDRCRSKKMIDKLQSTQAALVLALSNRRLRDFCAPGLEAVQKVKKRSAEQSARAQKPRRTKTGTPQERSARDLEIIARFKNSSLKVTPFSKRIANEFNLTDRQIRKIISSRSGT